MNTPGVSLFQGGESIKVNTELERQEEQELLEDQKRRNAEIGDLLQNAFDDLEDDDSTMDSSLYQTDVQPDTMQDHYKQQQNDMRSHEMEDIHSVCKTEIHKLKMMVESRTHELHNIKEMANSEHKNCKELQNQLDSTKTELERAFVEQKNTHELLVESKEKCSNLDNIISKLRNDKKLLESENSDLEGKLQTVQMLLSEIQCKYDMLERDFSKRNDRNAESRIKQLEERQRAKLDLLEQQLNTLTDQLNRKKQELETMHARYNALQSNHEATLVDKASKINELNGELIEAQRKFAELSARQNYEADCQRLQKLVNSYVEQIASLEKTITSLNERLSSTTAELDLMDSLLQQHNLEDSCGNLSQTCGKVIGSTSMNTVERVGQIKNELYRALTNVRKKRSELRKLQQTLDEKNIEIRKLRDEENKSLVLISTLKDDRIRMENRIRILEETIEETKQEFKINSLNDSKLQSAKQEIIELRQERDSLQKQNAELNEKLNVQYTECQKIKVQLKNVQVDFEGLKQEHENLKCDYEHITEENKKLLARCTADNVSLELERYKILLNDAQSECDRLKKLYTDITNEKENLSYELQKLRNSDTHKELVQQREKIAYLQRTLQLADMKSSELSKILETEKQCHERELKALREKCDKEKLEEIKALKESTNNCTKCIDYMAEITKFEIQIFKLNNLNSTLRKEIEKLTQELKQSRQQVNELNKKLEVVEQQDILITELREKAAQFEEYIKIHSSTSQHSPKKQINTSDKSTSTISSPSKLTEPVAATSQIVMSQETVKKIEARVRDEMAKIFAIELKRFQLRLQDTDEKNICLQREYQHVCNELQQRQNEVDLLKQAILAEREKVEELLANKDITFKEMMQKQKNILRKCRDEMQTKNDSLAELRKELEERQKQIEAERKSMKQVMTQWEIQRKSLDMVEKEWSLKIKDLRKTHEKSAAALQEQLKSAQRVAANYKRYAEDKEAHMLREYDRIKQQYDLSLQEMEVRITEAMEKKSREMFAKVAASLKAEQQQQSQKTKRNNKENKSAN